MGESSVGRVKRTACFYPACIDIRTITDQHRFVVPAVSVAVQAAGCRSKVGSHRTDVGSSPAVSEKPCLRERVAAPGAIGVTSRARPGHDKYIVVRIIDQTLERSGVWR